MKKIYLLLTLGLLLPGLLLPRNTKAQGQDPMQPRPEFTNCFPLQTGPPAGGSQLAARPQSGFSNYGGAVTPQGTLKVLVIFAGFTNDVDPAAPNYNTNFPYANNPWPQTDATHIIPGTSFPKNVNADFYTDPQSFNLGAKDNTLSNFYYQMSQHSAHPFKMQAVFFPKRINVTADNTKNARPNGFLDYTNEVIDAFKNDPDTKDFDFSTVDQRGASPNFQNDNSTTPPDHTIDYTIVIWRNPKTPFGTAIPADGIYLTNNGWASVPIISGIPSSNGQFYSTGAGFTQAGGMSGIDQEVFLHEFAHTLYNSPHYLAANRSVANYFNITEGPGMMGNLRTHFLANAWERWYNGWVELQTGDTHVNSDVQGPASLTATNGEFTLRDYVTTGDVVRIAIPGSFPAQHLWLENHQFKSYLDGRPGYHSGSQIPANPLRDAPKGIIAMVENLAGSRSQIIANYGTNTDDANSFKTISAQGNFDYTRSASIFTNNYFLTYDLFNFTNPVANPFGGESQITRRRTDLDGNNEIFNDRNASNSGTVSEMTTSFILNGVGEDGIFGPDAAFNTVGQKMGNSYNPAIFEHQRYDQANAKLAPIKLEGLSVELIAKDPTTGAITIKVRYDDVDIVQNTRWSGNLQVLTNFDLATGTPEVHVTNHATLTINKSGTNNRHTKTAANEFINPTSLILDNADFLVDNGGQVHLEGDKTTFTVKAGTDLNIAANSAFVVSNGAALILEGGSNCTIAQGGTIQVQAGGTLIIRYQATVVGQGVISIAGGGYLCVGTGAVLSTGPNFVFYVSQLAIMGANPTLGNQGFAPQTCDGKLQFCGQLSGGNPNLSVICPTGNEALYFDGVDKVVTIPVPQNMPAGASSPIHNIGDTFTIEATIQSYVSGGPNQTIFSNRQYDPSYGNRGLLFTLYAGQYLLLQINGQSFYDFSDPVMAVAPYSGCHQVAVTRDDSFRVHFYIDGVPAAYSPTVYDSPYSTAAVRFGGDAPYTSSQGFNGSIGEVRYWDYFRTDAEILRYLSAQLGGPNTEPDLKGYYDMRDVSGQTVADKAIVYNPTKQYISPTGFLGTTNGPDANDPTWVTAANLNCNVGGNFRQSSTGKTASDTLRLASHQSGPKGNVLSEVTIAPNPATNEATMHFQLRDAGKLDISIQDMTGFTRVSTLPTATLEAGMHDVKLPLHTLHAGLYLVIINSADGRKVIRLEVK